MNRLPILLLVIGLVLSAGFSITTFMSTVGTEGPSGTSETIQEENETFEVYSSDYATIYYTVDSQGDLYQATYTELDKIDQDFNVVQVVKQFDGLVVPAFTPNYYLGYDFYTGTLHIVDLTTDTYLGNISNMYLVVGAKEIYGGKILVWSFDGYYGGPRASIIDPSTLSVVADIDDYQIGQAKIFAENDTIVVTWNANVDPDVYLSVNVYKFDGSTLTKVARYDYTPDNFTFLSGDYYQDWAIQSINRMYGSLFNGILRLYYLDSDRLYQVAFSINTTDGQIIDYHTTDMSYAFGEPINVRSVYDQGTGRIYDFIYRGYSTNSYFAVVVWNESGYVVSEFEKNTIAGTDYASVVTILPILGTGAPSAVLIQREANGTSPEALWNGGDLAFYVVQVNDTDLRFKKIGTISDSSSSREIYVLPWHYALHSYNNTETVVFPIHQYVIDGNGPYNMHRRTYGIKITVDNVNVDGAFTGSLFSDAGVVDNTTGIIDSDVSGNLNDFIYIFQSVAGDYMYTGTYPDPSYNGLWIVNRTYDTTNIWVLYSNNHLDCYPHYKLFEVTDIEVTNVTSSTIGYGSLSGEQMVVYIPKAYFPAGWGNYLGYFCYNGVCQLEDMFSIQRKGVLSTTIEEPEDTIQYPTMPAEVKIKVYPLDTEFECKVVPYTYDVYIDEDFIGTITESNPELVTYLDEGTYTLSVDYKDMPTYDYVQDVGTYEKNFSVVKVVSGGGGVVLIPPSKGKALVKITFLVKGKACQHGECKQPELAGAKLEIIVEKNGEVIVHKTVDTTKPMPPLELEPGRYKITVKLGSRVLTSIEKYFAGDSTIEVSLPSETTGGTGGGTTQPTPLSSQQLPVIMIVLLLVIKILGLI